MIIDTVAHMIDGTRKPLTLESIDDNVIQSSDSGRVAFAINVKDRIDHIDITVCSIVVY